MEPYNADRQVALLKEYAQLPQQQQRLLQLLALHSTPLSKPLLAQELAQLGLSTIEGRPASASELDAWLSRMKRAGLASEKRAQWQCAPLLVEPLARRALLEGHFAALAQVVNRQANLHGRAHWRYYFSVQEMLRDLRIALYSDDMEGVGQIMRRYGARFPRELEGMHPLRWLADRPVDEAWLAALPATARTYLIGLLVMDVADHMGAPDALTALAERWCVEAVGPALGCNDPTRLTLATLALQRGRWDAALRLLPLDHPGGLGALVHAWPAFFRGDAAAAVRHFEAFIAQQRAPRSRRKVAIPWHFEPLYLLALLGNGALGKAQEYLGQQCGGRNAEAPRCLLLHYLLDLVGQVQTGAPPSDSRLARPFAINGLYPLLTFVIAYWEHPQRARAQLPLLETLRTGLTRNGFDWLAAEIAELLGRLYPRAAAEEPRAFAAAVRQRVGAQLSCVALMRRAEPWQRALNALARLAEGGGSEAPVASEERLVWLVAEGKHGWAVQPKVQKRTLKGGWSAGRAVALRRLFHEAEWPPFAAPADHPVFRSIHREDDGYGYPGERLTLVPEEALAALVGHPLVFWDDDTQGRIEVVRGEPELLIQRRDDQLDIRLLPEAPGDRGALAIKEGLSRIRVVRFDPRQREIATILAGGLRVPESAREQVLASLGPIAALVTVQSDIGVGGAIHETVAGDPTPHLQLLPFQAGLKALLRVRPFGNRGPYYRPGAGGRSTLAELEGKPIQAERDLEREQARAGELLAACPLLDSRASEDDDSWLLPEPEQALELLEQIHSLGEGVRIEWPEGQRLRLAGAADTRALRLRVQSARDWLNASGELRLPDGRVLDMLRLLELLGQGPGRFLQIGEGEYLALTHELRRRLGDLGALAERSGKGLRLSTLASLALEGLADEVGEFVSDAGWRSFRERYQEAMASRPRVPSTLQTELRDYQAEGFRWLARLARWGVGACLADDMGLGKTVQALALLLQRAPQGAALVVAPTSVTGNWRAEAARFAPTLNLTLYASADREALLAGLKPFDLVICSYGLLQQDSDKLAAITWHTVLLDEAQAIKNAATKRSQAAMALRGAFKLITTGTPVENHLGELWNLFRFLNPGLLGSLERFNRRFATPIERDHDSTAQARLRKLIQPFILRRTKTQVLDELPPRTEILQQVELNPVERAFYEALRTRALQKLEAPPPEDADKGQRQLQILAEITRLRRACCNSRLVQDGPSLPSAKLEAFGEILEELLENRHKALVFSQFVDHLALIRAHLEQRQVSYQYLDGSTPAGEREKRVRAFQSGEGDLFLISLRAGGVGLNLTAADYVIHMDPWWNPAVEDQASDRAHRIGQQRPVTIYRLVAKDTIEEKIVALHHQKRDLADSLLEGAEVGGKTSPEELLRLLKEA